MRKLKKLLLILNVILVGCTGLAYLSPIVHPSTSAVPGLMGLIFPALFFANVFFALGWLAAQKWYFLISLGFLIIGTSSLKRTLQVDLRKEKSKPGGKELSIATYNIYQLLKMQASTTEKRKKALLNIVDSLNEPDVICLQESLDASIFAEKLGYSYHHRVGKSGTNILSKLPIVTSGVIGKSDHPLSGWIDLKHYGDTIRLFALHLHSNRITQETEHLLEEGNLQESETWTAARKVLGKYSSASAVRSDQAEEVVGLIDKSPHPVVLCGDLNDVPQSYAYACIASRLTDGFTECGRGLGSTYAGSVPGLRIDYVFAGDDFRFVEYEVRELGFSDHYPVRAVLCMRE